MAKQDLAYDSLEHTDKVRRRTYIQKIIPPSDLDDRIKVYSEGALRIGFFWGGVDGEDCFLTVAPGVEFRLMVNLLGIPGDVVDPERILWFEGESNTVRDDEFEVRFANVGQDTQLLVFFDRIVWKKDDGTYPATLPDKNFDWNKQ